MNPIRESLKREFPDFIIIDFISKTLVNLLFQHNPRCHSAGFDAVSSGRKEKLRMGKSADACYFDVAGKHPDLFQLQLIGFPKIQQILPGFCRLSENRPAIPRFCFEALINIRRNFIHLRADGRPDPCLNRCRITSVLLHH